jgi:hypothetical protein
MTRDAIHRAYRPVERVHLTAQLRSDDTAEVRAENMLALIGVRWCDDHPNRAAVKQAMVDVFTDYLLLDKVALSSNAQIPYDAEMNSLRSWEAAIAELRSAT